jgi:hypothetical protein
MLKCALIASYATDFEDLTQKAEVKYPINIV